MQPFEDGWLAQTCRNCPKCGQNFGGLYQTETQLDRFFAQREIFH